tara:strand:- start:250 stop:510 length:261 start_codon:yes stop_codon:yes gene_type:complete
MLEDINACLKSLENSYMLSYKEVNAESNKLNGLLDSLKEYDSKNKLKKSEILNIAKTIDSLSIQNEYKLSLIEDFPEYFSNIRLKK